MPILENFLTYTEEDDNNKLTVTAPKALGALVDRDEDVYLYRDYGANYFDALDVDFELYLDDVTNAYGGMGFTVSVVDDMFQWTSGADIWVGFPATDPSWLELRRVGVASDHYLCAIDTLYYCTLVRAAGNDTVTLNIYDDSARTNLVDNPAVAGYGTAKWRYCYGFANGNTPISDRIFNGYVQNLDLKKFISTVSII